MSKQTTALPATIPVSPRTRLGELIRAAEKHGYLLFLNCIPNTCQHGPPCCEACKALPENQHTITVIG